MSIKAVRPPELQFHTLIEHSTEAIALITHDGIIAYASPSTQHVTGYEAQEVEGMQSLSLVHRDDREQVQAALTSLGEHQGAFTPIVSRLRSKEGSVRWIEGTITNRLADPTVGAWVLNYRDITASKRQEEALHAAEEREYARLHTLGEGMWLMDLQGRTLYANEQMVHLLGITLEERASWSILEFLFSEEEAESRACVIRSLQGHREQFTFRVRRIDGSERALSASTSPFQDATGTLIGVIGICTENTVPRQREAVDTHSEELLLSALKNTPLTLYQHCAIGGLTSLSPSFHQAT